MGEIQKIVNYWLLQESFSIGIADTVADQSTMRSIEQTIDEAKNKVTTARGPARAAPPPHDRDARWFGSRARFPVLTRQCQSSRQVKDLVQRGQKGELETQPGRTMVDSFENMVNRVLNSARQNAGLNVQEVIDETNNVKAMVMAGSKGNDINISQIIACVGQQNVEGKRIPYGFARRTLPHFAKDDLGPESRGFVENSCVRVLWLLLSTAVLVESRRRPLLHCWPAGENRTVPRVAPPQVPARPLAAGVLLPRDGRPRGAHRHGRQDRADRIPPAPPR